MVYSLVKCTDNLISLIRIFKPHKAENIIFNINTKSLTGSLIFDEIYGQQFTVIILFLSNFLKSCFSVFPLQKFTKNLNYITVIH